MRRKQREFTKMSIVIIPLMIRQWFSLAVRVPRKPSLKRQLTFAPTPLVSPQNNAWGTNAEIPYWCLGLPDLGCASDCLYHVGNFFQPIRGTNQIWVVTFHGEISSSIAGYREPWQFLFGKKSSVVFFPYILVVITKDHGQVCTFYVQVCTFYQVKCE